MKSQLTLIAAALALALGTSVQAAHTKQIDQQHKADVEKCKDMKGNAKDVCKKEADGRQKVAKAERDGAITQARKASADSEVKTKQARTNKE